MSLTLHALNEPELLEVISRAAALVHPVFVAQDWQWGWTAPHVPTREQIEDLYLKLAANVIDRELLFTSSGRLRVTGLWDEDERLGAPDAIEFSLDAGLYS